MNNLAEMASQKSYDPQQCHRFVEHDLADDEFGWGLYVPSNIKLVAPEEFNFDYTKLKGKAIVRADWIWEHQAPSPSLMLRLNSEEVLQCQTDEDNNIAPCPKSDSTQYLVLGCHVSGNDTGAKIMVDPSLATKFELLPGLSFGRSREHARVSEWRIEACLVGKRCADPILYGATQPDHALQRDCYVIGLQLVDPHEVVTFRTPDRQGWISWMSCSREIYSPNGSKDLLDIEFQDLNLRVEQHSALDLDALAVEDPFFRCKQFAILEDPPTPPDLMQGPPSDFEDLKAPKARRSTPKTNTGGRARKRKAQEISKEPETEVDTAMTGT